MCISIFLTFSCDKKISPITRVSSCHHNFLLPQEFFLATTTCPSHKDFKFSRKFYLTTGIFTYQQKFILPGEFSFCHENFDLTWKLNLAKHSPAEYTDSRLSLSFKLLLSFKTFLLSAYSTKRAYSWWVKILVVERNCCYRLQFQ